MLDYFDVTTFLVLIIVFAVSWWITQRIQAVKYFKQIGISGPKPHLIYGNIHQLIRSEDPFKVLREWQKSYGRVYGFYKGTQPEYMISDPEIIKEITVKQFNKFMDRPTFIEMGDHFGKNLLDSKGDTWKRIRTTLSPAFTGNKVKEMSRILDGSLQTFFSIIKEKSANKEEFDVHKLMRGLTMQMIAESVFALEVDCQRDPDNEFFHHVNDHMNTFKTGTFLEMIFAFPWFISTLSKIIHHLKIGKFMKGIEWLLKVLQNLIAERMAKPQKERIDMIQLMINAIDESVDDHKSGTTDGGFHVKKGLSMKEIEVNAFIFLVAGFDTTYNAATFVIHHLTLYPEIQNLVHKEIDENVQNEIPSFEEIKKLSYLDQVISETLRLYPLVSIFLSRKCLEDCTISGIKFQKGMAINFPPYVMHYDEEYWQEPKKFDPDRFSLENKSNITPMTYMPFGLGPRNCIGQRLAIMEVKLALVTLLKNYTLSKGPSFETKPKLEGHFTIIRPSNGVKICATPRSSINSSE